MAYSCSKWSNKKRRRFLLRLFIYELINCVGASTPQRLLPDLLYAFWVEYRELDPEIDHYVKSWLRDFVIYYALPPALIDSFVDTSFERALIVVRQAESAAGTPFSESIAQGRVI